MGHIGECVDYRRRGERRIARMGSRLEAWPQILVQSATFREIWAAHSELHGDILMHGVHLVR